MDSAPTPLYFIGPKQIISSLDSNKVLDIEGAYYTLMNQINPNNIKEYST